MLRDPAGSVQLVLNAPGGEGPQSDCRAEVCTSLLSLIDGAELDFSEQIKVNTQEARYMSRA